MEPLVDINLQRVDDGQSKSRHFVRKKSIFFTLLQNKFVVQGIYSKYSENADVSIKIAFSLATDTKSDDMITTSNDSIKQITECKYLVSRVS